MVSSGHMEGDVLEELARRYVWWQEPATTLARQDHFLCQLMQLGTLEDMNAARRIYGDDAFRNALRTAPPGVLDARSWNFWHLVLFKAPPPAAPERPLQP
jgi:hypothetical protein